MKAVQMTGFGEPAEVLRVEELETPQPAPGEVRVRMLASPVNPSDVMTLRGTYGRRPSLPFTPGYEGVGVVEESGGGLLGALRRNKRVAVLNSITGNWAEQAVVSVRQVVPVPDSLVDSTRGLRCIFAISGVPKAGGSCCGTARDASQ